MRAWKRKNSFWLGGKSGSADPRILLDPLDPFGFFWILRILLDFFGFFWNPDQEKFGFFWILSDSRIRKNPKESKRIRRIQKKKKDPEDPKKSADPRIRFFPLGFWWQWASSVDTDRNASYSWLYSASTKWKLTRFCWISVKMTISQRRLLIFLHFSLHSHTILTQFLLNSAGFQWKLPFSQGRPWKISYFSSLLTGVSLNSHSFLAQSLLNSAGFQWKWPFSPGKTMGDFIFFFTSHGMLTQFFLNFRSTRQKMFDNDLFVTEEDGNNFCTMS